MRVPWRQSVSYHGIKRVVSRCSLVVGRCGGVVPVENSSPCAPNDDNFFGCQLQRSSHLRASFSTTSNQPLLTIRAATPEDYDGTWEIFSRVIQTGDTYVFDPATPKEDLAQHWFAPYMHTVVAIENNGDDDGVIVGTYIVKPNQIGLGNHVANASYMVHPDHHGKGIGKQLCQHSLEYAKSQGFGGMQFNIVVSTNEAAVKLWEKFGFEIIGTTPNAFRHALLGPVDAYIMYREL